MNMNIFSKIQEIIGWPITPESPIHQLPMNESIYKKIEQEFSVTLRDHIYTIEAPRNSANISSLVKEIDAQYTNNYFVSESGTFKGLIDVVDYQGNKIPTIEHKWKIRGKNLITKIKKMQTENPNLTILDLGCGYNMYKQHLANVTGVDPYIESADIICKLDEFQPKNKFDIIICFGPMNWYSYDEQFRNMQKIKECLSETGVCYWSHVHNYYKIFQPDAERAHEWVAGDLDSAFKNNAFYFYDRVWKYTSYFNWTEKALTTLCDQVGLIYGEMQYDDCGCYRPPMWRLFCELRKN